MNFLVRFALSAIISDKVYLKTLTLREKLGQLMSLIEKMVLEEEHDFESFGYLLERSKKY